MTALIASSDLTVFFHEQIQQAITHQKVRTDAATSHYLTRLLTVFSRSDSLFEHTQNGVELRPLAMHYAEALEAPNEEVRNQNLQRLGDVALFVSGVFPDALNRQCVDVDYYIAMGGNAYGSLSALHHQSTRWRTRADIFQALAAQFRQFVDVLNEVCERAYFTNNHDVMRLYEKWQRTGSARLAGQLRQLGIEPIAATTKPLSLRQTYH